MDRDKQLIRLLKESGVRKLPDSNTHVMRLEIRGASRHKYIVSRRNTALKRWECACPGWVFHRHCKHLETMAPILDQIKQLTMEKPRKLLGYRRRRNAKE